MFSKVRNGGHKVIGVIAEVAQAMIASVAQKAAPDIPSVAVVNPERNTNGFTDVALMRPIVTFFFIFLQGKAVYRPEMVPPVVQFPFATFRPCLLPLLVLPISAISQVFGMSLTWLRAKAPLGLLECSVRELFLATRIFAGKFHLVPVP